MHVVFMFILALERLVHELYNVVNTLEEFDKKKSLLYLHANFALKAIAQSFELLKCVYVSIIIFAIITNKKFIYSITKHKNNCFINTTFFQK